jgi:pentatricopeptide repeat protein
MPPRFKLLTKRWSPFDLSILPFLAPRVFQPWPCKGRPVHSATAQAVRQKSEAVKDAYEALPLENSGGKSHFVGSTSRIQGKKREVHKLPREFDRSMSNDTNDEYNWRQGLEKPPGGNTDGHYSGVEASGISEEESRREYEAIWDSRSKKLHEALRDVDGLPPGPESSGSSEEEDFRRKYREIWGPRPKIKPPMASVRRVPFLPGDEKDPEEARPVRREALKIRYHLLSRSAMRRPQQRVGLKRDRARQLEADRKKSLEASRRRRLCLESQARANQQNITPNRPKWVRLSPYTDSSLYTPFRTWHRRFAVLNLRHELSMKGKRLPRFVFQQTSRFPLTFIRELMDEGDNSLELRLKWEKFSPQRKMEIWPELMIKTLQTKTGKTLKIIAGTYAQEPFPPPYALSDCLNYVISFFLGGRPGPRAPNLIRRVHNSVFGLLQIGPKDYLHISQHSTFLLLSHADPFLLKKLYKIMTDIRHPLHQNTLMNFAYRFAKVGETDTVLEILQKLKLYGSDFNSPKMLSLCSKILDRSVRGPDTAYSDSDIFERMLGWGMQPNIITYNVLIKNSVDIGNHSTAWQIHDMMIESGIEPDTYTYSILLNDSKHRMDSEAIEAVMEIVRGKGLMSAHIVTDVLDAIFLLYRQKAKEHDQPSEPHAAFYHMLKVYMETFRIQPLARIIPWISDILPNVQGLETSPIPQDELEQPPMPTQALMISAFLYGLRDAWAVKQFYNHFRLLISTSDPVIADFLETTHIWNSVLLALGKFPDTLGDCTAIVGDMLAPSTVGEDPLASQIEPESSLIGGTFEAQSKVEGSENDVEISKSQRLVDSNPTQDSLPQLSETLEEKPRRPHIPPKPDVRTWSILLKIFMNQHQTRAAAKVFTMMQEKGIIEPNFVTWTSLVNGYARVQDTKNTADVISRMERAGLEVDLRPLTLMFKISKRRELLEAMRRRRNMELNPGAEFLDLLQNDMRNPRDEEQSHETNIAADGDFIFRDLEADVEDSIINDSDIRTKQMAM